MEEKVSSEVRRVKARMPIGSTNIRIHLASFLVIIATVFSGCAGVAIKPIKDETQDKMDRGIRYYESAPYLLVYADNKGGISSKILYMPDLSRKMSAKPYNFMASSEFVMDFTNGVLTGSKSTIDETVIPKAVVSALEKAASSAVKFAALNEASKMDFEIPQPYLYKIVIDSQSVLLIGERAKGTGDRPLTIKVSFKQE